MPLDPKTLDALKASIEARRSVLQAEIAAGRERARAGTPDGVADRGDESIADVMAEIGNAEVERDMQELQSLDAALERLADHHFGICVQCGVDIGLKRLRAEPGAARCIECQRQAERARGRSERLL